MIEGPLEVGGGLEVEFPSVDVKFIITVEFQLRGVGDGDDDIDKIHDDDDDDDDDDDGDDDDHNVENGEDEGVFVVHIASEMFVQVFGLMLSAESLASFSKLSFVDETSISATMLAVMLLNMALIPDACSQVAAVDAFYMRLVLQRLHLVQIGFRFFRCVIASL